MKLCNIIKMNQDLSVFFQEIGVLLSSIKDGGGGYIIKLDEYEDSGTYSIKYLSCTSN